MDASAGPHCPWCKHPIDPKTDVLWDNTGQLRAGGVSILYCGWCGSIWGGAPFNMFSKRSRE